MNIRPLAAIAGAVLLVLAGNAAAQELNKFDGYAVELNADSSNMCAMRFVSSDASKNSVEVFEAGTGMRTPAAGISACGGSRVAGNRVDPNGADQSFCFQGPAKIYELRFTNGRSYLWPAVDKETGFYNVKDFRPVKRAGDGRLIAEEPADYSNTIKNAMVYMAARMGGVLRFPEGDYVVGTTDGNTRDPNFDAITIPAGVTVEGVSANFSTPSTNLPNRRGASRIRLRNPNQTIFRIGNCTNFVTVKNLELLGNVALFAEARRDQRGTIGIEARGIWPLNRTDGSASNNNSLSHRFENLTFQEFETGLKVHNVNGEKCDPNKQFCNGWNFDYIKVDLSQFINNATGIYIDTGNTDWKISNSFFATLAARSPGNGIHIHRGGMVLVEQSFGAGYDYDRLIGGTFIYVGYLGALTVINSGAERSQRSMYFSDWGGASSSMLTIVGSIFSDPMELNGRITFTSTGNLYTARTIRAAPNVKITSMGDRFCMDPLINPGGCLNDAGRTVNSPAFNNGKIMFQTGRLPEASGKDRIDRQPNFFGYDVEIADGVLQHDPNTGFKDLERLAAPAETGTRVKDGAIVYCKDCKPGANGVCTQGKAGVDGAFAKRINNRWRCD